jgi:hypothetical protein
MSDSTSVLASLLLTSNQAAKEAAANNLFNAASPSMLYALNPATTTGLTFGYIGGRFDGTSISNGTVTLTASNTNYIVASRSTGAVSVSTATTNWDDRANYARLYKVVAGGSAITSYEDHRQAVGLNSGRRVIQVACSDETTPLTTGVNKIRFRAPHAMTLLAVRASLSIVQSSGSILTVDINKNGTTILSTKLTIDNSEFTSTTAATPAVISVPSIADDDDITVDIDQVGDGTACGLKVTLIGWAP